MTRVRIPSLPDSPPPPDFSPPGGGFMSARRRAPLLLATAFLLAVAAALLLLPSAPANAQTADDCAIAITTTCSVSPGTPVTGDIETSGDGDYFSLSVTSGVTYQIDAEGTPTSMGTLPDPYFELRDASDTQIASNDDGGTGVNARLTWTASGTETVYVRIESAISGSTGTYTLTVSVTNYAATGAPTITGTALVGDPMRAVTSGIMDADGLTSPTFTYQWIRVDGATESDISGATSSIYTPVAADLGKTIKVKVSFTDDGSNAETLTSAATAAVAAAAGSDKLLLGNTGGTSTLGVVNVGTNDTTQPFKTGKNSTGYTLSRIQVDVAILLGTDTAPSASEITVTLRADSSGDPADSALATFSFPDTWTPDALNEFTLATPASLDPDKTYHIHIAATKKVNLQLSALSQVDAGSASDWSFSKHRNQNSDGDWVADTGALTMKLHGSSAPGAPTGLTATEGHHAVKLDWTAPADGGGFPITGYEYSVHPAIITYTATESTGTSLILDNLDDSNYPIRVRAVNAIGSGNWSDAVIGTIGPATVNVTGDGEVVEGTDAAFTLRASKPVLSVDKPLNVSVLVSESGDQVASAHEGPRTVSFALNGSTAVALSVPTVGDTVFKGHSVVTAAVRSNSDYTVGSAGEVWVADDEPRPAVAGSVQLNGTTEQTKTGSARLGHVRVFQEFKTGVHPGGYELHSIKVEGASKFGVFPSGIKATVRKYGPDGPVVAALGSPSSWTTGMNEFTAPDNTILSSRTNYVLHFSRSGAGAIRAGVNGNNCVDNHAPGHDCYVGPDGWNRFIHPNRGVWTGTNGVASDSIPWGKTDDVLRFSIEGLPAGRSGQEPSPPENFTAQPCERKYSNLSWTAPFGSPDRYEIRASGFSSHLWDNQNAQFLGNNIVFVIHTTETEYRHTARGGITYYTVRAINASGPGMWSAVDRSNLWEDGGDRSCEPASQQKAAKAAATPEATGLPVITGTVEVGETLTADTSGISDVWGLDNAVFAYQWLADGKEIPGATSATHTLADADAGKAISVRVSFTDGSGNTGTLTSEARHPNTPATGAPAIRGKAKVWDTLTADTSSIADADGLTNPAFRYRWLANGREKSGATGSTYNLAASDAGKAITVRVTFIDDAGNAETLTSAAVALDPDDYTMNAIWEVGTHGVISVGGSATGVVEVPGDRDFFAVNLSKGQTYRIDVAGHGDADALEQVRLHGVFIYSEELECSGAYDDPGVTTYVLTAQHSQLYSVAVGAEGDGTGGYRVSVAESDDTGAVCDTAPVAAAQAANTPSTGAPAISGAAQVGETLTADTTGIADEDGLDSVTFAYQWQADDAEISGANGSAYTLAGADKGKAISVKVSFTDDAGNEETLTSAATAAVEAKPNSPATGAPAITGTAQVGETLTADLSGIADADGLDNAAFAYRWQSDSADISGATDATYTLADSDEGKAVSVTVSFTDDAGNEEELTSAATDAVKPETQEAQANTPATGLPAITGIARVGVKLTADTSGIADEDGLDSVTFAYQWLADGADISGATDGTYTLTDTDEGKTISVRVSFTDDAGNEETLTSAATDAVEARPNRPATGALAITGTARVGELLTADVSNIKDDDGLDRAAFAYQWQADGTDLSGATGSSYTLAASDEGKAISVTVSFTDYAGHEESFTSTATAAVVAAAEEDEEPTDRPHGLTAEASGGAVVLTWTAPVVDYVVSSYHILRHRPEQGEAEPLVYVNQTPNDDTAYTDTEVEPGVLYVYRVKAIINFFGDLGEASDAAQIRVPATAQEQEQTANNPATGAPTISGKVQVGETLTADTSGISDDDGLSNAVFSYQWQADGANISGATGETYTLADSDEGKAVSMKVSFTDDAGNDETLTSTATDAVEARPNSPATGAPTISGTAQVGETLTANTSGIADTDGLSNAAFAYQWQADGADISGATGSSYTLVDSDEGKAVSVKVSFTDDRGHGEELTSAATDAVEAKPNTPATGAPTITGTALVGETLTAATSGIADEDGLTNAVFSYQWQADGANISGATGETYTLADSDEGKAVSMRVSFTDDAGNDETLTSTATDAVEARPNSPATGAPTISGTAQVGETLTANTSGIADTDGLSNAAFAYQWQADGADISGATGSSYTLVDSDEGKAVSVKVSFTDDRGHGEELTSAATDAVEAKPNTPATGAPTITGTALVGETLTAATSGIADEDGLTNAVFSYQWQADGANISGATGETYTLADSDEGKAVSMKVSFTDDAGNDETLTSTATDAVEARPNSPATGAPTISGTAQVGETLTANTSGIADTDGLSNAAFAYQWQADGADISGATGSSYTLVDSDEGKAVSVKVSFTDDRGHGEELTSAATDAVEAKPNTPATGAPTITGTALVGETLTAATSGIADEDGLTNAVFSYQWLADGAEISGTTGSTYTLVDADEGKAISVAVSFTDDAGN